LIGHDHIGESVIMDYSIRIYFVEMRNTVTMALSTLAESDVIAL